MLADRGMAGLCTREHRKRLGLQAARSHQSAANTPMRRAQDYYKRSFCDNQNAINGLESGYAFIIGLKDHLAIAQRGKAKATT